ncbi:dTMP kinase [Sphingomonas jatrophae]|uniref:Thymidylate kinase n=1 Tax=Sphingomonas jatrophae TaxID=1166337 RepID=A0A1I6JPB0_9SPHN|nr:dTMP kinase [Sphingomonas jatrophae]SFR80783.1 thymidylate kinase [Sphingomonas jatrophae]
MTRGRFISLEGGEGVGKSTQAPRLAQAIADTGREVVLTREPGGSDGAEAIRGLLLTGESERWGARAEALLFAAARADHVARTIRPALERGAWVVCDRFLDSSRAYQGGADGIGDEAILTLHGIGSEGVLPDRTLVLDLPPGEARGREAARDGGRSDRIGGRDQHFHARVAETFRRIAAAEPERVSLVEAAGTPEMVTDRLMIALMDLL